MGAFDIWWEGGCWEWDVAAGIALLQEAGGLVTTANPPSDPATAEVITDVRLGSRLYLAIRYVQDVVVRLLEVKSLVNLTMQTSRTIRYRDGSTRPRKISEGSLEACP
jgi:hypothetical protein